MKKKLRTMQTLTICRICLISGVKMHSYNDHCLKQFYEEIMALKVNKEDSLPKYFCYECAAMLYKFHKFKEKCWTGHESLLKILAKGRVTTKSISKIHRNIKLKSSLGIAMVSKNVRTYTVKNNVKPDTELQEMDTGVADEPSVTIENNDNSSIENKPGEICGTEKNIIEEINWELNDFGEGDLKVEVDNKVDVISKAEEADLFDNLNDDTDIENEKFNLDFDKSDAVDFVDGTLKIEQPDLDNFEGLMVENTDGVRRKSSKRGQVKEKQFEHVGKDHFDRKHWLIVNLSDEEAIEEFKTKAHDCKYLGAAYKCTRCFKGFSREDMLTRHMKLRHKESFGHNSCRFCTMSFKRPCLLNRHLTQHYVRYKCLRCDLVFGLKSAAMFHNDYHNGVIRKCEHCGEEFRHQSTYYTHLRSHRSEHVCTLCGESFVNEMGLSRHKLNMHVDDVNKTAKDEVDTYCVKCDVTFETRKAYERHLFHSAKHGDNTETPAESTESAAAPYKLNSAKLTLKSFTRKPRKPTPCNICDKNFSSYLAYIRHHSLVHKGDPIAPIDPNRPGRKEDRYICEICGISLARCSVQTHLNTHTREIRYTCDTCGREFNSKAILKQHQLTHTTEKPVPCPLCEKRFKQSSSMKLHYRTFHLKEPYPKRKRKEPKKNEDLLKLYEYGRDSDENMALDRWR